MTAGFLMTSCMCSICSESRQIDRSRRSRSATSDEAGVAEIANVHVALFDLPVLEVDLLLQVPNLKLQSLQVGGGCHAGPTAGVGRKKKTRHFLAWVIGSYNGAFSERDF